MNESVNLINSMYPVFVKSMRDLTVFDLKVQDLINRKYGKDTIGGLNKMIEYNKEFENIKNNIINDTPIARLAAKRKTLFDKYTDESYKVTRVVGFGETLFFIDILEKYFKEITDTLI